MRVADSMHEAEEIIVYVINGVKNADGHFNWPPPKQQTLLQIS